MVLNPEKVGATAADIHEMVLQAKERQENILLLKIGCGALLVICLVCPVAGKVAIDLLNRQDSVSTPTPEPTPTQYFIVPSAVVTSLPPPTAVRTEVPLAIQERIVIKEGDTIWDLVQDIKQRYPQGGVYQFKNSRTGVLSPYMSEEQVLEINNVFPGDELIFSR